ncbi:carbohydrate kinase family protein, partial [bacterium]|nr:carbohydrate kinase family protein [bacterium]
MIELRTDKPILCIGDVVPDIILPYGASQRVLAAVARGETINGEQKSAEFAAGGSIGNTAHGIAVLGGKSWFAGKVGNDYFGRFLKQTFESVGVDTRFLILDDEIPTSMVFAVLGDDNDRITYVIPRIGASQH